MSFIALGANIPGRFPDPAAAAEAALLALNTSDIKLMRRSRLYRSIAWPNPADPAFINAVVAVETDLAPAPLLARLHGIEAAFGRVRRQPNAPRPLDLDIIDYAGLVSSPGGSPILPHPRLTERPFVLLPLIEIAPGWRHPVTGATIDDLIRQLPAPTGATPL